MQLRQRPHLGWMGSSPSSPLLLRAAGLVRSSDFVWLLCVHVPWLPGRRWPVVADANQRRGRWAPEKTLVRSPGGGATTGFAVRSAPCVHVRRNESPRQRTQNTRERRVMSLRGTVVKIVTTAPPALWSYIHRFASRSSRYTRSHRARGSRETGVRRARTRSGTRTSTPRRYSPGDPRDRRLSFKTRRQHGCVGTANARRPTRCSRVVSPEATGSARSAAVQQRGARAARESRTPNPGGRMLGPVDLPVQVCAGPPLAVTLQVPIATSE